MNRRDLMIGAAYAAAAMAVPGMQMSLSERFIREMTPVTNALLKHSPEEIKAYLGELA